MHHKLILRRCECHTLKKRFYKMDILKYLDNFIVDISTIPLSGNYKFQKLIKFNWPVSNKMSNKMKLLNNAFSKVLINLIAPSWLDSSVSLRALHQSCWVKGLDPVKACSCLGLFATTSILHLTAMVFLLKNYFIFILRFKHVNCIILFQANLCSWI